MGQKMSSTGENSRKKSGLRSRQRKKKQFRRGAKRSTTNKPVAEAIKQRTHACAATGNSRNRFRSFIGTPVRERNLGDPVECGRKGLHSAGENSSRSGNCPGTFISASCTRPGRRIPVSEWCRSA